MPDIHIYLRDDLYQKYKSLENKSQIFSKLLEDYFLENSLTEEEIIANVKKKMQNKELEKVREQERKKLLEQTEKILKETIIKTIESQPDLLEKLKSENPNLIEIRIEFVKRGFERMDIKTLNTYLSYNGK
jgi:hypothetical protein